MSERETPTDLLIRLLEEIEGVEDVIVVARHTPGEDGSSDVFTYTNGDFDFETFVEMLGLALTSQFEEEGEDVRDDE